VHGCSHRQTRRAYQGQAQRAGRGPRKPESPKTNRPVTLQCQLAFGPFFIPGDPKMGEAVRGLAGKRSAVLLANHGPVVAGKTLDAAVYAMEELEETAKLAILTRSFDAIGLSDAQVAQVVQQFNVD
jgi:hypothetical protein